jgi:hypothetical protein
MKKIVVLIGFIITIITFIELTKVFEFLFSIR